MVNTHRVQSAKCPRCRAEHDAASNAEPGCSDAPKPGDFTVCASCGSILRFAASGLEPVTRRELDEAHPETRKALFAAQRFFSRN